MFENAKPRRVELRINTATDLLEEHEEMHEQLAAALATEPPARPGRMSGKSDPTEADRIAEQIQALENQMEDSWVTFVLQPRPKKEWRSFRSEHPPIETDDLYAGVDMDALLREFVPRCVVEPDLTPEDWKRAFDEDAPGIWPGDQARLINAVFGFYMATFEPPKSRLLSEMTRTRTEQREQLERLVSPNEGSEAGSSRSVTTTSTRRVNSRATR